LLLALFEHLALELERPSRAHSHRVEPAPASQAEQLVDVMGG
jgi:hypothetical protein